MDLNAIKNRLNQLQTTTTEHQIFGNLTGYSSA